MLTALMVAVGVLLTLVVAALVAVWVNRRAVTRRPHTFRCAVRPISSGVASDGRPTPTIESGYGEWVSDVLVLYYGRSLQRVLPVATSGIVGRVQRVPQPGARWLGAESARLTARLDDGSAVWLVASIASLPALAGPYVSTALPSVAVE